MSIQKRFNKYVSRRKDTCWNWTGTPRSIYGQFKENGKQEYAHRVAYRLWVGDIGPETVIHHTCGNTRCVRPDHLQAISPSNNTAEMLERRHYQQVIDALQKEVRALKRQLKKQEVSDET